MSFALDRAYKGRKASFVRFHDAEHVIVDIGEEKALPKAFWKSLPEWPVSDAASPT